MTHDENTTYQLQAAQARESWINATAEMQKIRNMPPVQTYSEGGDRLLKYVGFEKEAERQARKFRNAFARFASMPEIQTMDVKAASDLWLEMSGTLGVVKEHLYQLFLAELASKHDNGRNANDNPAQ